MTLQGLFEEYSAIEQIIEQAETEGVDVDQAIRDAYSAAGDELSVRVKKLVGYCRLLSGLADQADQEAKRIRELAQRRRNRVENIKSYLRDTIKMYMGGRYLDGENDLKVCKNGGFLPLVLSKDITPDDVSDEFIFVKKDWNKKAIRDALSSGQYLDFAALGERGESLRGV